MTDFKDGTEPLTDDGALPCQTTEESAQTAPLAETADNTTTEVAQPDGDAVVLQSTLHGLGGGLDIIRVDLLDVLHADSADELLYVDGLGLDASELSPGSGVGLVAGHGGGAVVQDDHDYLVVVEQRVHQRGHSGMEERGVPDERYGGLVRGSGETSGGTGASSHADDEVGGLEWRGHSEGVASDVGAVDDVLGADGFLGRGVHAPVGASRA